MPTQDADGAQRVVRDPWHFQRWAFETKVGNPVRKAVLSMLAMMADAQTGRCEAKQDTLAQGVEASERAVRGHLNALERDGVIARRPQFRRDRGRRGDEFLLLAPGITEWPDGEPVQVHPERSAGGSAEDPVGTERQDPPARADTGGGVLRVPGKNGPEGTTAENDRASGQKTGAHASANDPRQSLPDDFPEELRPHARHVFRVLRDVARQHPGAREVYPRAVGLALMAYPRRPLVETAHALAGWAVDPPRPIKDVVGTYRTFLKKERDLAAIEQLAPDGTATTAPAAPLAGVTPLHGRRMTNAETVEAQIRALRGTG